MKSTTVLAIGTALAVAGLAFWNSMTIRTQQRTEMSELTDQIAGLDERLEEVSHFQHLLQDLSGQHRPTKTESKPASNNSGSVLDDRVRNQGRANDNQWQEIDFLTSQQVFHKKLIDQINFDLKKIRRETRESNRDLQQLSSELPPSHTRDLLDLRRRVDDLYRRIQRNKP